MIRPAISGTQEYSRFPRSWGQNDKIDRSNYWVYGGSDNCSYMYKDYLSIVELVAKSIYYDFGEVVDRRLSIGDACPRSGACSGHPGNSHGTLKALDTNYYTTGPNNTTQYRPGTKDDAINVVTKIWKDGGPTEYSQLLRTVHDWERNFLFFYRLHQIFPEMRVHSQQYLRQHMMERVEVEYGRTISNEILQFLQGDSGTTYNHYIHAHINFGNKINWSFNIGDFLKRVEKRYNN